jgi:hypothetical protein
MGGERAGKDQVKAKATKPEQSRKRPATVTARKLLEANSSRMLHHLSRAPLLEQNDCTFAQSKGFPRRRPISTRVDVFMQHPLERSDKRQIAKSAARESRP